MNAKWILIQYLSHFKARLLDLKKDPILQENIRFRNCHSGQRLFILGSGNSIQGMDLTLLKEAFVMTQNNFHMHSNITEISPTYHVVVPKYQPREFDDDWNAWLKSMDARLPDDAQLFLGKNTKYLVDELSLFEGRVSYLQHGLNSAIMKKANVDITRTLMAIQTVLLECLAIGIFMGFSEICLVGFDLDQICHLGQSENENTYGRFYGKSLVTANNSEKRINASLAATGQDWINMWIIWRQCHLLKTAAEERGCEIINATRGGLLNMFKRQSFESILGTTHSVGPSFKGA